VEEFRIPLTKGPSSRCCSLVKAKEVTLDLNVQYLAGRASLLPVKLRYEIGQSMFLLLRFEDFVFGNGPVKEGSSEEGGSGTEEEAGRDAG